MAAVITTAALCLALACGASGAPAAGTFPAFLWGSRPYVAGSKKGQAIQAAYEVLPASHLTEQLFGGVACASGKPTALDCDALAADAQQLVSVFVQGNVGLADIAAGEASPQAGALQRALKAAPTALYLSSVQAQGLKLPEASQHYGDCGAGSLPVERLSVALAAAPGPTRVLLCEAAGTQHVAALSQQLADAGRPFLVTYAGRPEEATGRPVERTLISTSAVQQNSTVLCSAKCMTQVRLFEVLILLVLLLSALAVGLCMLHILDAPSRFEAEKKEMSRHQD